MFFATEPLKSKLKLKEEPEGKILCVSHSATYDTYDKTLEERLKKENKYTVDLDFMKKYFKKIKDFDDEFEPKPYLLWFEPYSVEQRIINQFAVFSLMAGVDTQIDQWINDNKDVAWIVCIPGEKKALLRRRLNILNINYRTIYPGLDGIARWQKAYYSDDDSN